MPTREETINNAIQIFRSLGYSPNLDVGNSWLGIYRTLLWFEPINFLGYSKLPHIIDADKLRPSSPTRRHSWLNPSIWQERSQAVTEYLAEKIGCPIERVHENTDLLMKQPVYEGLQRQNILGTAFVGLIKYILGIWGSPSLSYESEVKAANIFAGISFPGRTGTPRIDLLVKREGYPRAIISAKWSLRHDRLSDLTNECPVYKTAYERIYRGTHRDRFLYYVITNEFDPARLTKIIGDTCIDGVVHVHKNAVVDICRLNGRLEHMIDLSEFVLSTTKW